MLVLYSFWSDLSSPLFGALRRAGGARSGHIAQSRADKAPNFRQVSLGSKAGEVNFGKDLVQ
jgi:hypothetical protein